MKESSDPPFEEKYKNLFAEKKFPEQLSAIEECDLPLIDLSRLNLGEAERRACKKQIAKASKEWGFFQVINHGIPRDALVKMRDEQMKLFQKSFEEKKNYSFSIGSYRWGTPSATCLKQLSWSEAFHVSLTDVFLHSDGQQHSSLRQVMEQFAVMVSEVSHRLVEILAEELGDNGDFFKENCLPTSCYLRMNRYPPCKIYPQMFGIMPHTDSDFITVLHQDDIGGLQLVKDNQWFAVKPNQEALVINIGDLFQVWSNNVYKSVQHRVVANSYSDRFSTAYFFCPTYDTVIKSTNCVDQPFLYRSFSFRQYREQVEEDVKIYGHKIGLPRFLIQR